MRLKDKIAVITGAGSGVGRTSAILFAREGAKVVCVDINEQTVKETVDMLTKEKHEAFFIRADVSRGDEVRRMAEECGRLVKKVDVLFNNAGRTSHYNLETTTEENWFDMINTNLTSVFLCSKYLLPLMKAAGSGCIVNHASIDSLHGNMEILGYCAAKGGLIPLTHVMAGELARHHIRVNAICSGGIQTSMTIKSQSRTETLLAATPMGRRGTAEEVAYPALFLACDESSYITGASLVIDGGRTALTQGTPMHR